VAPKDVIISIMKLMEVKDSFSGTSMNSFVDHLFKELNPQSVSHILKILKDFLNARGTRKVSQLQQSYNERLQGSFCNWYLLFYAFCEIPLPLISGRNNSDVDDDDDYDQEDINTATEMITKFREGVDKYLANASGNRELMELDDSQGIADSKLSDKPFFVRLMLCSDIRAKVSSLAKLQRRRLTASRVALRRKLTAELFPSIVKTPSPRKSSATQAAAKSRSSSDNRASSPSVSSKRGSPSSSSKESQHMTSKVRNGSIGDEDDDASIASSASSGSSKTSKSSAHSNAWTSDAIANLNPKSCKVAMSEVEKITRQALRVVERKFSRDFTNTIGGKWTPIYLWSALKRNSKSIPHFKATLSTKEKQTPVTPFFYWGSQELGEVFEALDAEDCFPTWITVIISKALTSCGILSTISHSLNGACKDLAGVLVMGPSDKESRNYNKLFLSCLGSAFESVPCNLENGYAGSDNRKFYAFRHLQNSMLRQAFNPTDLKQVWNKSLDKKMDDAYKSHTKTMDTNPLSSPDTQRSSVDVIKSLAKFAIDKFKIGCMNASFHECFLDIGGGEAFLPVCYQHISEKVCASDTYEVCYDMARCFENVEKLGMSREPQIVSNYTKSRDKETILTKGKGEKDKKKREREKEAEKKRKEQEKEKKKQKIDERDGRGDDSDSDSE